MIESVVITSNVMPSTKLPRAFQQVFFATVCLTLLSGGGSFWLSQHPDLNPQQSRIFETCNTTWNMGIGAIFGLLSSKATDRINPNTDDD